MAELNISAGNNRRKGGQRSKKLSTRVDLTPMVDLGFLLITFFIFTTTMSRPTVTTLIMPANGDSSNIGRNAALTAVPLPDNKIFFYHGTLDEALQSGSYGLTGYSMNKGIGDVIRQKQLAMDQSYKGGRKEMMFLIRPTSGSTYQNVVSLLDETQINKVGKYTLEDITAEEQRRIAQLAAR